MLEAAGSFAGGGAVTLGLWLGLSPETIFLAAAGALGAAAAAVAIAERRPPLGAIPLAGAIAVMGFGLDGDWAAARRRAEWRRLMDRGGFRGSFSTARGEYVYGERDGRFTVLSRTSAVEALPDRESSAPIAAMAMAQHPAARRVLVAGTSSYPLCRRLLALPAVERVTWLGADPEYPRRLREVLPERYCADDPRLHVPGTDARAFVRSGGRGYDLAVLDFPDPTTLHLNRYYTREFFQGLRDRLEHDGVVCISITGGANYLSPAAADMGGSIYRTLRDVFGNTAIKAGEQTWLFASAGTAVSASPAILAERFFRLQNADDVFPRGGFESLFETARIEKQKEGYAAAAAAGRARPNTDAHPRALAYAVRLAARRSGLPGAGDTIGLLGIAGIPIAAAGLGILFLLRLLYRLLEGGRRRAGRGAAGLDSLLLVATAGASGIGLKAE
ncbi:MAG: hypothetical protein U9R68_10390 [Planctomycetota bacterium]|nr:hypothetical protein [Planctomycetota bacterium]